MPRLDQSSTVALSLAACSISFRRISFNGAGGKGRVGVGKGVGVSGGKGGWVGVAVGNGKVAGRQAVASNSSEAKRKISDLVVKACFIMVFLVSFG